MIVILDGDVKVNSLTVLLLVLVCREVGAQDEIVEAVEVCRHRVVAVWVVPHLGSAHTHTRAHAHKHTHAYVHARTHAYTYTYTHIHKDTHTHAHTHKHTHAGTNTVTQTCTHKQIG